MSLGIYIYMCVNLRRPLPRAPLNGGVGGTRALAHLLYYIILYYIYIYIVVHTSIAYIYIYIYIICAFQQGTVVLTIFTLSSKSLSSISTTVIFRKLILMKTLNTKTKKIKLVNLCWISSWITKDCATLCHCLKPFPIISSSFTLPASVLAMNSKVATGISCASSELCMCTCRLKPQRSIAKPRSSVLGKFGKQSPPAWHRKSMEICPVGLWGQVGANRKGL